jgi:4-deoxy-L-threo-5-hexosulose-uronate ketol-isomerase
MEIRHACSPGETAAMNTQALRKTFLIETLFKDNSVEWVYSHYDRVMIGGVRPVGESIFLATHPALRSVYFLERRELGIINIGGPGMVNAGGQTYPLEKLSCLYIGKGEQEVRFSSTEPGNPAQFYLLSTLAHATCPTQMYTSQDALPATVGSSETSNQRTIYKYIHADGIQSCQLVMGLTTLHTGSVWNTMPAHVHDRRMEAYLYFDIPEGQRVLHLMGTPDETRHIWLSDRQAVISPPWSVHSGCGTASYSFIWGMGGENKDYTDMDPVAIAELL